MMGCRYNAKNTLDKNYLYLAEKHGAQVFAETKVVDVRPLDGSPMAARVTRCSPCNPRPGSPADAAASPAAAWSSRPPRWARWTFSSG